MEVYKFNSSVKNFMQVRLVYTRKYMVLYFCQYEGEGLAEGRHDRWELLALVP